MARVATSMSKKQKTVLKNFRFTREVCQWLEKKSAATGRTQTSLLLDALKNTYGLKGRSA